MLHFSSGGSLPAAFPFRVQLLAWLAQAGVDVLGITVSIIGHPQFYLNGKIEASGRQRDLVVFL